MFFKILIFSDQIHFFPTKKSKVIETAGNFSCKFAPLAGLCLAAKKAGLCIGFIDFIKLMEFIRLVFGCQAAYYDLPALAFQGPTFFMLKDNNKGEGEKGQQLEQDLGIIFPPVNINNPFADAAVEGWGENLQPDGDAPQPAADAPQVADNTQAQGSAEASELMVDAPEVAIFTTVIEYLLNIAKNLLD